MEGTPDRGSLGLVTGARGSPILACRAFSPEGFSRETGPQVTGCQRLGRIETAVGRTMPNPGRIGPLKRRRWRAPPKPLLPRRG